MLSSESDDYLTPRIPTGDGYRNAICRVCAVFQSTTSNVVFRAVDSNPWNSALSSKAASDRLQLNVGFQSEADGRLVQHQRPLLAQSRRQRCRDPT